MTTRLPPGAAVEKARIGKSLFHEPAFQGEINVLGIDVHKRSSQIAVLDKNGNILEEGRVEIANLDDFAQRYAGSNATLEATSNYYHLHNTISAYMDVIIANPDKLKLTPTRTRKLTVLVRNNSLERFG